MIKTRKSTFILAVLFTALMTLSGCADNNNTELPADTSASVTEAAAETVPSKTTVSERATSPVVTTTVSVNETASESNNALTYSAEGRPIYFPADGEISPYTGRNTIDTIYGYYNLSDREQKIYDKIENALLNHQKEITFSSYEIVTSEEIDRIAEFILECEYRFFYLNGFNWSTSEYTGYVTSLRPKYHDDEDIDKMNEEMETEAKKILSELSPDMSDYEIVKLIHDRIVNSCIYSNTDQQNVPIITTAYGCLVNHKANCQGYSRAFVYLCHQAGIKALNVGSETHMWNLVEIDGEYYHMDVTSDSFYINEYTPYVHYNFFALSDEKLAEINNFLNDGTFTVSNDYDYEIPAANGTEYNYFSYNDLIVSNIDEVKEIITRETADEMKIGDTGDTGLQLMGIQFACSDREAYDEILSELRANNNETALSAMAEGINQSEVSNIIDCTVNWSNSNLTILILFRYTK